jgi:peptide/nickel transport system ATP-binding protein
VVEGESPSSQDSSKGCRFRARCLAARSVCGEEEPRLREIAPNHFVACHYPER